MTYNVVLLPGDGIGREVMTQGRRVLEVLADRFGISLDLRELPCGGQHYLDTGEEWPDGTFKLCRDWSDAILLGAVGWPGAKLPSGFNAGHNVIFDLRFGLDLYANVRPVRLLPGVPHLVSGRFQQIWAPGDVDLVIVRENTEGLYANTRASSSNNDAGHGQRKNPMEAAEPLIYKDHAIDERIITYRGSERIVRFAFELARERGRRGKVTCVDKSNVLRGCQLFRSVFDEVGLGYRDVQRDRAYIDAFCHSLTREPERYDVVVTTNLFGDIASDLAAVLQGGLGLAASANLGNRHALFEPVHGSAPDQAGRDTANPSAMLLSVKMMLEHWERDRGDLRAQEAARALEQALRSVLSQPELRTPDIGGPGRCSSFGRAVIEELERE